MRTQPTGEAIIGRSAEEDGFILIVFPVAGAILGAAIAWLLGTQLVSERIISLIPTPGPIGLAIAAIERANSWVWGTGIGAGCGLILALFTMHERLIVTVRQNEVTLTREGKERSFAAEDIGTIFMEDKDLILLDAEGFILTREQTDRAAQEYREAFTARGYPWQDTARVRYEAPDHRQAG